MDQNHETSFVIPEGSKEKSRHQSEEKLEKKTIYGNLK